METPAYLDQFEQELTQHLLRMLKSMELQGNQLLESDDITAAWDTTMAATYVADSVKEIAAYPLVALGWALYTGMGAAHIWDTDFETFQALPNLYTYFRDLRGYDCMDEAIREEVLGLRGEEYQHLEQVVQSCAHQVLGKIRREQIEPQSPTAYYVYQRSVRTLFRIGASIQLNKLGYKFEKV